jgi:DNA-binding transcriptional MerR regulator
MPDPSAADLTVGQAAARLGVTVRALHHWDEIGLVRPSRRSGGGYRLYTEPDLERLRRVVVYRELGLELDSIRSILDDPGTDTVAALRAQRAELAERIARLESLDDDLARMIDAHERGLLLSAEEQARLLGPEWDPRWPEDARARYGGTLQWQQYAERAASRTPADWETIVEHTRAFDLALAQAMEAGVAPGSPDADALVDRHRELFSAYFPLTREMQVVLVRGFEADPAFAAHYDRVRPGLAGWFRRIVDAAARAAGVDPDAAAWPEG